MSGRIVSIEPAGDGTDREVVTIENRVPRAFPWFARVILRRPEPEDRIESHRYIKNGSLWRRYPGFEWCPPPLSRYLDRLWMKDEHERGLRDQAESR